MRASIVRISRKLQKKRIVILGGGFGGVYAALHLEKLLGGQSRVEIRLVSRDNFFLFTPMLHEIAASDLEITNIVNPLRKLLRQVEVVVGDVNELDLPNRRVVISERYQEHLRQLHYDHLVIALGSVTNFYDLPGLADLAIPMKTLHDAVRLRAQVLNRLEAANAETNSLERCSLLTFVVAGGGFAGVETVASLNDFIQEVLPFYPNLCEAMCRVVLVHSGSIILPELGQDLGEYTKKVLVRRGVDIRFNSRVRSVTQKEVSLSDGTSISSRTLVWTAGIVPSPLISSIPSSKEKGRLIVNQFLQLPDWPNVWAIGDCAFVPDIRNERKSHPPTAQHAMREGKIVAQNIVAALSGRSLRAFSFKTIGLLASIGRRMGVARIFGFNFSGFFAWWMWRTVYLSKLPGLDKKVRVAFDWTLDLLFPKDVCAVYNLDRDPDYHRPEPVRTVLDHEDSEITIPQSGNGQLKIQHYGVERDGWRNFRESSER
jgi:NADH:ubiquinone reductase (H+-translocating)